MIFSQISSLISLSQYLRKCRQKRSDGNAQVRTAQEKKWDHIFLAVGCTYIKFKWQTQGIASQHGMSWHNSVVVLFSPFSLPPLPIPDINSNYVLLFANYGLQDHSLIQFSLPSI